NAVSPGIKRSSLPISRIDEPIHDIAFWLSVNGSQLISKPKIVRDLTCDGIARYLRKEAGGMLRKTTSARATVGSIVLVGKAVAAITVMRNHVEVHIESISPHDRRTTLQPLPTTESCRS